MKKRTGQKTKSRRTIQFHFMADDEETALIRERMELSGIVSFAAYARKMMIDGYVINLDMPDVREVISLLRYCDNNLKQLTKRADEIGSAYVADIMVLQGIQEKLWDVAEGILSKLAKIK